MKKMLYFALAGLALLACKKEVIAPVVVEDKAEEIGTYTFTLNASVSDGLTKSSYGADEKTFSWSAGDKIAVLFHKTDPSGPGDDNIFFTLTTSTGGTSASFSGSITSGYEIGASSTEGGVKWALYPVANHSWNTTNHRPNFVIPEVTDFTEDGVIDSANIPMFAKGDGENNFVFAHSVGAYRFTFDNIDATKVRFKVTHNTTHKLSGSYPMNDNGCWYAQYASAGSANQSVSYIKNVSSKTAVFYFGIGKDSESSFQPTITLYDETTGYILYQKTAKNAWGGNDALKPLESRIVLLPAIPAPGSGSPIVSKFGINWGTVTASASGAGAIRTIKAKQDGNYLYLLLDIKNSDLYNSVSYSHANKVYFYLSDGSDSGSSTSWNQKSSWNSSEDWLSLNGVAVLDTWGLEAIIVDKNIVVNGVADSMYIELKLDRTNATVSSLLSGTSVYVAVSIDGQYVEGGSWKGSSDKVGYGPANGGDMLSVTMTAIE